MLLRHFPVAILVVVSALAQPSVDSAKHVADRFMADVAADRTEAAIQKWHTQGEEQFDRYFIDETAKSSIRSNVADCGRPVRVTALNNGKPESATFAMADRTVQELIFFYRAQTPRGVRRFDVTIQAAESGEYHVAGFGCSKHLRWNSDASAADKSAYRK